MNPNEAAGAFSFASPVTVMSECDRGHINHTYFLDCAGGERYVLQHLNRTVFPDPKAVMANVVGVTAHIRRKLLEKGIDPTDRVLSFVPAGGKYYFEDSSGGYWRAYRFVSGACPEHCASPAEFARVGRAFGVFQNQLSDYDAATLCEVIPDFHNTPRRYEALLAAAEKDEFGRVADCRAEIGFARERAADYGLITDGLKEGIFPLRVTHNDTKLNNIILDPETGEGRCVIDLDTVMPGSLLYDFGDAIRYGAATAAEDEEDLSRVSVDADYFAAFAEGFSDGVGKSMTPAERRALPDAARLMTLETGIRFLTDYLSGDTYFRIHRPDHNLIRARNQFAMAAGIERKYARLQALL